MNEAGDIVGPSLDKGSFHAELRIDIVQITGSLELGVSEPLQGTIGIEVSSLFDVPTWRLCRSSVVGNRWPMQHKLTRAKVNPDE